MKKSIFAFTVIILLFTSNFIYSQTIYPPHCDTLLWSRVTDATYYHLQLLTGITVILDSSHITDTFFVAHNLYGTYSMRVKAYNLVDSGNWSNPYTITFGIVPPPPIYLGHTDSTHYPFVLYWSKVQTALDYRLQIFGSQDTTQNIIFDTTQVDTFITVSYLSHYITYYLRLRSYNYCGYGMWSPLYFFTVPINGIKQTSNEIPDKFELFQNYPNPFNPTTKIKFDVPFLPLTKGEADLSRSNEANREGVIAKLIIYDLLGREVSTLVNEKLNPGTYEVGWDGTNYPSGVYFYKLTISDPETSSGFVFNETKRMVLVK